MVGMSGKNSEPRTSGGGHKKHPTSHNKPQPPVEALQMARILEDTSLNPKNAGEKVQEILTVVPGRSEEEIFIALHDHDFDIEKAISALLDSDGSVGQGEWTTTGGRKWKKKSQPDSIETIAAPGDGKSKSGRSSRGTNRAASQSTREGYGGSVHVSSGESRGGRGGGRSGGRGGRRTRGPPGERRNRGRENRDNRENRDRGNRSNKPVSQTSTQVPSAVDMWDTAPTNTTDNTVNAWPPDSNQIPASTKIESYWEEEEPPTQQRQQQQQHQPHAVFPEAIPSLTTVAVSTPAETTPPLLSTTTTVDRDTNVQVVLDQKEGLTELMSTKPTGSKRSKRLARSQIPTKPVEMPAGIESLDVQFGQLGIDFGGLESEDVSVPATTASQLVTEPPSTEINTLLSYNAEVQRLSEDPGVISVGQSALGDSSSYRTTPASTTTTTTTTEAPEVVNVSSEEEKALEGPPGLTHPTTSNHETTEMAALISTSAAPPAPIELPHQTTVSQSHSFPVSSSGDLLLPTSTIASTSVNTRTSSHAVQHSTASQSATQGKHSSSATVPPGMMYPPPTMVPQYPFSMMAPMYPNYADPSDLSRGYPSVSMAYYTSSSDPSIGGGLSARDHSTTSYQDPAKFGHGADVTSPISSNPSQQAIQQPGLQQGQQMGPHFYPYGSMFYPAAAMYPMGFSHSIGPKPSGSGSSYPGVSTYQPPHQGTFAMSNYEDLGGAHDFSKMYSTSSLNKSTVLPTTSGGGGTDIQSGGSSSSFKHFDNSKSGYSYTMPQLGGSQGAGYNMGAAAAYMQMPTMAPMHPLAPVMPTGAHDGSTQLQQSRGSQKHSSKGSAYNPSSAAHGFWSQGSHS